MVCAIVSRGVWSNIINRLSGDFPRLQKREANQSDFDLYDQTASLITYFNLRFAFDDSVTNIFVVQGCVLSRDIA